MKYYLIAGEASGDLHGSNLIREIKLLDTNAEFRCWGGDLMQAAGAVVVKHIRELAFMGFIEVVRNLKTILSNLKFSKEDIRNYKPDVLILIDYPGFNLRITEWAKEQGLKIVFYISPQVWAWKESRVPKMKEYIDKMMVILPFEKDYYEKKWNWQVEYVGHPLVQVVEQFKQTASANNFQSSNYAEYNLKENIVALLPGSRKQEILKKLPIMLLATKAFSNCKFIVAKAPSLEDDFYNEILKQYPDIDSIKNDTYNLLLHAKAALVTSGTATLETALFNVPQVVCYKGSSISYQIAKRLIKVKYISLVNLIMDKMVVKELIQKELTADNVVTELSKLLADSQVKQQILENYATLKHILSVGGDASANAAKSIYHYLLSETKLSMQQA